MLKSKKAFQSFRETLKKAKVKARLSNKRDQRWELTLKGNYHDEAIYIDQNDDKSYTFHLPSRRPKMNQEVRGALLKLAKEIALQEGSPAVFIRNSPEDDEVLALGFHPLDCTLNSTFLTMYSLEDVVYYYNIVPLYTENKVGIIKKMKELTIEMTALDPKRTFKLLLQRGVNLNLQYYFAGVEGEISISYANLLFKDGEFSKEFQEVEELGTVMDEHTKWIEKKTRLKNLYDPPKKHLKEFISKSFSSPDEMTEKLFSLLSKHIPPEQIEDQIVKHEPLKKVRIDEWVSLALICGFYFSFIDTDIQLYTDLDVLLHECRNAAFVKAREKYNKHLKDIERRVEEIKEKRA